MKSMITKQTQRQLRRVSLAAIGVPLLGLLASHASAAALLIVNPGFETGTAPVAGATGWTVTTTGGYGYFTTTAGAPDSIIDPDSAAEGSNWLTGNRLATGQATSGNAGTQNINQVVNISSDAALIDLGTATVNLNWQYADNDPADTGSVTISFFSDVAGTISIGTALTTGSLAATDTTGNTPAPWAAASLSGAVPIGARSLSIRLTTTRTSGSAGNVHFDDFSGSIIPEPGAALLGSLGMLALLRRRR
jgi:MYXO-CTERM domain-containing protein